MKNSVYCRLLLYWACVFLCLIIFGCSNLAAQRIRSISSQEGLSQGFVAGVVQGKDGYIWASTLNGLDRFDGESFKTYRHNPADSGSIASNIVTGLEQDQEGNLWVLTKQGIQMYDVSTDRFITPVLLDKKNPAFNSRYVICFDHKDQIWVFRDYKLFSYKINRSTVSGRPHIALIPVCQFDFEAQNKGHLITILPVDSTVIVGTTDNHLYTVNLQSGTLSPMPVLVNGQICRVWKGPNDEGIWVQAARETILMKGEMQRRFPVQTIKTFTNCTGLKVANQTILFGLHTIYRFDGRELTALPLQIPEEIISACTDHQGNLWIGTNAQGLRYITVNEDVFPVIQKGKSSNHPVVADLDNNIWVFDPAAYSGDVGYYRKLMPDGSLGALATNKTCRWMDVDHQGRYWFVFADKTMGYQERPGGAVVPYTFTTPGYLPFKVFCPAGREIWFTSDRYTLITSNIDTKEEQYIALDRTVFDSIISRGDVFQTGVVRDIQKRVWIGLTFAVWGLEWDEQNSQYHSIFLRRGAQAMYPGEVEVLAVAPDLTNPDVLWAGGPNGLARWNIKTKEHQLITVNDGLPDDFIYSVVPDERGNLWLGTNKGLVEYNPQTHHCRTFSTLDGIPGAEFNTSSSLKTKNNLIYMNTVSGITWFDPARINRIYPKSRMTFTNIAANGIPQTVSWSNIQQYQFQHDQNSLSIDFALLNYIKPEENRYEYQLLGEKAGWIQLGHKNNVAFPQLPPGDYVFQVRGISSDGQVSDPVVFQFAILPPWWKTWWAYLVYILMAGGLAVAGFYAWLRFERVKTALVLKEQTAASEQFRTRLLSNITHEIRTPLTLIIGLADQLKKRLAGEDLKKINLLAKSGDDLLQLSNQVLELAKLESTIIEPQLVDGNLSSLTQQIADYFLYLASVKPLQLDIQLPEEPIWARYDESAVKSILTNILSNALKFTPAQGTIKLTMYVEQGKMVFFEIKDTGIGMSADEMAHIFDRFYQAEGPQKLGGSGIGLSYVKELADRLKGSVKVYSQPGQGATFTVRIPYVPALPAAGPHYLQSFGNDSIVQDESALPIVLMVEDNQAVAQYMMECFRGKYNTLYASDGHTGFKMAVEHIPDVIITDIMMPGINGLELCKSVKNNPYTCHIPVIMATALVEKEAELVGRRSGADAYIAKPFLQEELLLVTSNLLQLRSSQHQYWAQQVENDTSIDWSEAEGEAYSPVAAPPPNTDISQNDLALLHLLNELIETHFKNGEYTVAELLKDMGMSKTQLHRKLTALTGNSAVHYLKQRRLKEARKLLKENPDMNIAEVSYASGFNDPNYFSAAFSAAYGVSPRQFREG